MTASDPMRLRSNAGSTYLLIEERPDGVFLFSFEDRGEFDTWHKSIDEAKAQAVFQCGERLAVWQSVPDAVDNPIVFMRSRRAADLALESSRRLIRLGGTDPDIKMPPRRRPPNFTSDD